MRDTNLLALSCCAVLALGAAACGSNDSSPSSGGSSCSSTRRQRRQGRRHHQRRRRHVPGARLPGVGRPLQGGPGHDRQLPAHRLRRRHRAVQRGHRRLRRHRLRDEGRRDRDRPEAGQRPGPRPDGARRGDGLLQRRRHRPGPQARRRDGRRHLPRQDQEVERPEDREPELGHAAAEHEHQRLPPLRRVRHDGELHVLPHRLLVGLEERPRHRQVGQVADRHRRQGQRRRRRLREADQGRGRLRRAGVRAAEQVHDRRDQEQVGQVRRAVAAGHVGRRPGRDAAGGPALQHDQLGQPGGLPDHRHHVPARLAGRVQGRPERDPGQARQELAELRASAPARQVAPQLQYAPLPDNIKTAAQGKVDALQCNGAAISGAS